jgi:uncharacterized protein (TIGR02646 family)
MSLLKEQHYICCYCQQLIEFKDENGKPQMRVEHFEPKGGPQAVQSKELDYKNLLAACQGNSDSENKVNHCDAHKQDTPLKTIPNPAHGKKRDFKEPFKYDIRVKLKEVVVLPVNSDPDLDYEINNVLNLNEQTLRSRRFTAWNTVYKQICNPQSNNLNQSKMKQILDTYEPSPDKVKYKAFCGFISKWVEEKLSKLQK